MNPVEPDTILTKMQLVKAATENCGQTNTLFTKDQHLFKMTTQVSW